MNKIYLLILLALIAGCAKTPLIPETVSSDERQQQLEQLNRWQLKGRLALSTPSESWTVTLNWSQDDARYLMQFIAPLGQGTYALRGGEGDGVYLLTPKNEVLHAQDAETLLRETVGWQIPLSGFRYWVRGLAEPGIEMLEAKFDEEGRVTQMLQGQWKITIARYMGVSTEDQQINLPNKVFMQNEHFKLKLIIQNWDLK